jgi:hypothetical protein
MPSVKTFLAFEVPEVGEMTTALVDVIYILYIYILLKHTQ